MHFACDLSDFGSIAGNEGTNQYFQFRRMAAVCVWLLSQIGGECAAAVVSYEICYIFYSLIVFLCCMALYHIY